MKPYDGDDRIEQIEWMNATADEIYSSQQYTSKEAWDDGFEEYAVMVIDDWTEKADMPTWFDEYDREWMINRVVAACEK